MRFLKDMIAKKMSDLELEDHFDEEWDEEDHSDWESSEVDDAFDDEPSFAEHPEDPDEAAATAFASPAEDTSASELPLDDPEESGRDDEATMKIWEMFNEEEDRAESEEPVAQDPDEADDTAESSGDLAREALKSMIGTPPVVEKTPRPVEATPKKAAAGAQDAQPAPRAGRVKTRMLGFHNPETAADQIFDRAQTKDVNDSGKFPVGWLVIIEGPGRGTPFALHYGVSTIGRAADQKVCLGFGDNSISRDSHAVLAYDEDSNTFYIGHTGKANLVRLNGRPVLATEEIDNFDLIRIGETTLRFVGFCGPEFAWDMTDDEEVVHAQAS